MTDTIKCFQCGGKLIEVTRKEQLVNNSVVVSVKSICADPECQKKIDKYTKDRIVQQREIEKNRLIREKESAGNKERHQQIVLGPKKKNPHFPI